MRPIHRDLRRSRALEPTLTIRARQAVSAVGTTDSRPEPASRNGSRDGSHGPRVSVVIPALNEAENLPFVLPRIPPEVDEIILVDGHSTDDTVELARHLRPDLQVVIQAGLGKGSALRSGFAACSGEIIVMLDADGSTDPAEIPLYVGALLAGADFAKGSRFLQGAGTADMPFYRRLGNKAFVVLVRLLFGGRYSDLCYGYNAFWADVPGRLALEASGFEIETMMNVRALRMGLRVVEVPSFEHRRVYGQGRLKALPDGWRVLKTIFAERFNRPAGETDEQTQAPAQDLEPVALDAS